MKKLFLALICIAVLGISESSGKGIWPFKRKTVTAVADSVKPKQTPYDSLFKTKHDVYKGMITLHKMKGKLYFEFPDSLLGREMLLGSTISEISNNMNGTVGTKSNAPLHIMFTKTDKHVQLRLIDSDYTADEINPSPSTVKSLKMNTMPSILRNFKIEVFNNDSTAMVFDVTELFVSDIKEISPFSVYGVLSGIDRSDAFKSNLSYLGDVKSFSDNVVIRSTLSYTSTIRPKGQPAITDQPFTAVMTRSIVLLGKEPYRPRITDSRMSVFPTGKYLYSDAEQRVKVIYYANRWRLEPSDMAAYKRGEKVEPVKPIVFYVDSNFPEKWKSYIFDAVNLWNKPFEAIGFKNAIRAEAYPTDDPEFDPDNIKYSCIRYAPIPVENAMGPSWVDPRSGEIINASVYVFHDVIKLLNNWIFIQTAQADERVRKVNIPDQIIGEGLRYVICHEVGHCLGYMHNMSGSAVIPVDSLRSPSFTKLNGTTTSIMDYARFNYVAQPGDMQRGVKLTPPEFGLYDYYGIKWLYTPTDAKSAAEEYKITSDWITKTSVDSVYRYGKQQFRYVLDPKSMNEDLGDDAMRASEYGIKNLKYILANMDGWFSEDDKDYSHRQVIYNGIINQYYMYFNHVFANVGGVYVNEKHEGDPVKAYLAVPGEKQRRAVKFLLDQLKDLDWIDNKDLISKLPPMSSPKSVLMPLMVRKIVTSPDKIIMNELLSTEKKPYTHDMCQEEIYNAIWQPTLQGKTPTEYEMMIQREYVKSICTAAGLVYPGAGAAPEKPQAIAASSEAHNEIHESEGHGHHICSHCAQTGDPFTVAAKIPGISANEPISGYGPSYYGLGPDRIRDYEYFGNLLKVQSLLRSRQNSGSKEARAHYGLILRNIEKALTK